LCVSGTFLLLNCEKALHGISYYFLNYYWNSSTWL